MKLRAANSENNAISRASDPAIPRTWLNVIISVAVHWEKEKRVSTAKNTSSNVLLSLLNLVEPVGNRSKRQLHKMTENKLGQISRTCANLPACQHTIPSSEQLSTHKHKTTLASYRYRYENLLCSFIGRNEGREMLVDVYGALVPPACVVSWTFSGWQKRRSTTVGGNVWTATDIISLRRCPFIVWIYHVIPLALSLRMTSKSPSRGSGWFGFVRTDRHLSVFL